MNRLTRALLALTAAACTVLALATPASATTHISEQCVWNHSTSIGAVSVQWERNDTHALYTDPVNSNAIEGEPGCEATGLTVSGNTNSEPKQFYTATGYCTRWATSTNGGLSFGTERIVTGPKWQVVPGVADTYGGAYLVRTIRKTAGDC